MRCRGGLEPKWLRCDRGGAGDGDHDGGAGDGDHDGGAGGVEMNVAQPFSETVALAETVAEF